MTGTIQHAPFDCQGRRIRTGDLVRIVGVPDLTGMAPEAIAESLPVFQRLVGSVRRIAGFEQHGLAEIAFRFRGGRNAGCHSVWIEPSLLRLRRPRPARSAENPGSGRKSS